VPVKLGGDVIVAINGAPVRDSADIVRIVGERLDPGRTARFTVYRGSRKLVVPVVLAERPPG
jgi:S1-C subfamily serine protease